MHDPREREWEQIDRVMQLFVLRGVLDDYAAWWQEQRAQAGYNGLSGRQIMDWIRAAHPELVREAELLCDS